MWSFGCSRRPYRNKKYPSNLDEQKWRVRRNLGYITKSKEIYCEQEGLIAEDALGVKPGHNVGPSDKTTKDD
jgi:hypothetical protein